MIGIHPKNWEEIQTSLSEWLIIFGYCTEFLPAWKMDDHFNWTNKYWSAKNFNFLENISSQHWGREKPWLLRLWLHSLSRNSMQLDFGQMTCIFSCKNCTSFFIQKKVEFAKSCYSVHPSWLRDFAARIASQWTPNFVRSNLHHPSNVGCISARSKHIISPLQRAGGVLRNYLNRKYFY